MARAAGAIDNEPEIGVAVGVWSISFFFFGPFYYCWNEKRRTFHRMYDDDDDIQKRTTHNFKKIK